MSSASTNLMPLTASAHQMQTHYRQFLNQVINARQPLVLLNHHAPEAVILDMQSYEDLASAARNYELASAQEAISTYEDEKKKKLLKKLNSINDL